MYLVRFSIAARACASAVSMSTAGETEEVMDIGVRAFQFRCADIPTGQAPIVHTRCTVVNAVQGWIGTGGARSNVTLIDARTD
jgi:hypothetical protein